MKIEYTEAVSIKKKKKDYGTGIPRHEIEALARCLLPEIQSFLRVKKAKKSLLNGNGNRQKNKKKKQLPIISEYSGAAHTAVPAIT